MQDALAHEDAALDQEQSTHALTVGVLAEPRTLFTEGEDILFTSFCAESLEGATSHNSTVPSDMFSRVREAQHEAVGERHGHRGQSAADF